jgi:hypothetical protein
MTEIKIGKLYSTSAVFFEDSESFLDELSHNKIEFLQGGLATPSAVGVSIVGISLGYSLGRAADAIGYYSQDQNIRNIQAEQEQNDGKTRIYVYP